jgi:hypothetical protein
MEQEKCNVCNYENGQHKSLCPNNIINSDAHEYQDSQIEE